MAIVISVILLFLGIGVLVLIHVCIVGRTLGRESSERNVERESMSQDDIEKLPCFDFKEKDIKGGSSPPADCAVCLENFRGGERCRLLPCCNHTFHAECVDLWLLRTPICPICRVGADSVIKCRDLKALKGGVSSSSNGHELEFNPAVEVVDSNERVIEVSDCNVADDMGLNPTGEVVDSSEREAG